MIRGSKQDRVAEELSAIPHLSRDDLLVRWRKAHGNHAPKGVSRRLLEYSAAYQVQVKAYGGLKPAIKRNLCSVSKTVGKPSVATPPTRKAVGLGIGTRLLRDWHGRTHSVEVTDGGFRYDGETYKSLSKIAYIITGARWSGPRFFGLRAIVSDAPSTPVNPQKRDWSRSLTALMPSARPVKPTFNPRRDWDGLSSRKTMTMAASPVAPWSAQHFVNCSTISSKAGLILWWSTRWTA